MSLAVAPIVELYRYVLQPIAPFTWLGLSLSTLDVAATVRLCVALRQLREKLHRDYIVSKATSGQSVKDLEERSFVRDAATTLIVVYGGEAVTSKSVP